MSQCDFHAERGEQARAEARIVIERPGRDRIQYLCSGCVETYSDAVQILGPVDPRDVPKDHRARTLNRWLEKVEFPDEAQMVEECWEWTASTIRGYGAFRLRGQTDYAHRYAYELAYEEPAPAKDDDVELLHECDNKSCVNPAHLWLGTRAQNLQHAVETGQIETGSSIGEETREEIRDRYGDEDVTQTDLAEEFGTSQSVISQIIRREYHQPRSSV